MFIVYTHIESPLSRPKKDELLYLFFRKAPVCRRENGFYAALTWVQRFCCQAFHTFHQLQRIRKALVHCAGQYESTLG